LSKLTFTGLGSFNGVSTVFNVDDNYQIQTGREFSNSLREFGYYVAF
jgi:hypothetical protein